MAGKRKEAVGNVTSASSIASTKTARHGVPQIPATARVCNAASVCFELVAASSDGLRRHGRRLHGLRLRGRARRASRFL